jgi:hypothetical protein
MKSLEKMSSLADRFEQKLLKQAQVVSAQSGTIQDALTAAKLWELSDQVVPMLNQAGVPENASVATSIVVDKLLNVNILVTTTPPHASAAKLAQLLKNSFSAKMKAALQAAKLSVADTITVGWLTF